MTWKTIATAVVTSALVVAPFAASAHEGNQGGKLGAFLGTGTHTDMGLHLGSTVGVRAHGDVDATTTVKVGDREDRGDMRHATSSAIEASTTAARLTTQANRIIRKADVLAAFGGGLSARLASTSLSASSTAQANAFVTDFNTSLANAKTQAQAALGLAGQVGTTTASTTVVAQAKTDLKDANGFIRTAIQDLRNVLKLIFKSA